MYTAPEYGPITYTSYQRLLFFFFVVRVGRHQQQRTSDTLLPETVDRPNDMMRSKMYVCVCVVFRSKGSVPGRGICVHVMLLCWVSNRDRM